LDAANLAQPLRAERAVTMPSKTASALPMLGAAVLGLVLIAAATSRVSTAGVDVVTYHNDVARTGQNLNETILSQALVSSGAFGKLGLYATDGKVDAQPLYLSSVPIPAVGVRNVLYVVTEHDSVYAFDADNGAILWRITVLAAGETPSDQRSCGQVVPEIGITSTPVIDRSRGPNGVIYVVGMSKSGSTYFQRLHALDITTGTELFGGPRTVQATFPGSGDGSAGGVNTFDPKQYEERSALLLVNGRLITAWTSHCDIDPYTGWIMAYDPATLTQTAVLNVTPNGSRGAFWMAGAGPAADPLGNIYLLDGNGTFGNTNGTVTLDGTGFPTTRNFGNAFLKVSTAGGLAVADYFATFNTVAQSNADTDLGSGGTLVFPDFTDSGGHVKHLAVGAGKDGHIYVVDRDAMGKWNASSNQIYQDISGALSGSVFSKPAYFNGTLYYGASGDSVKAFPIASARVATTASSKSARVFPYPGSTPGISASGTSNPIVWAVENSNPAVLHAYDATNLAHELYNSSQAAGGRDSFGPGNKFITPTIVNGRVYVGTQTGVAVFGSLAPAAPTNLHIIR
jgi:outer membrane protein assembly factor BamB